MPDDYPQSGTDKGSHRAAEPVAPKAGAEHQPPLQPLEAPTVETILKEREGDAGVLHAPRAPRRGFSRHASIVRKVVKTLLLVFLVWVGSLIALVCLYAFEGVRPVSTLMLMDYVRGSPVKRTWVPFDRVAPSVWQSVVSSEDGQFCSHNGVDWAALNEVIDSALEGERTRGASTIAMQNAKNLFLWNSRSYIRKGMEIPIALLTDLVWSKRRQMEIYLNIAEWGEGIYGIEAAARHHFKRSARRLTRRQAARLVASLPNPILRRPARPTRGLRRIARTVERRARVSRAYTGCLRQR